MFNNPPPRRTHTLEHGLETTEEQEFEPDAGERTESTELKTPEAVNESQERTIEATIKIAENVGNKSMEAGLIESQEEFDGFKLENDDEDIKSLLEIIKTSNTELKNKEPEDKKGLLEIRAKAIAKLQYTITAFMMNLAPRMMEGALNNTDKSQKIKELASQWEPMQRNFEEVLKQQLEVHAENFDGTNDNALLRSGTNETLDMSSNISNPTVPFNESYIGALNIKLFKNLNLRKDRLPSTQDIQTEVLPQKMEEWQKYFDNMVNTTNPSQEQPVANE